MATLAQVKVQVDRFLADLWPKVVARQEAYRAKHGHYWQGLRSHILDPADGAEVAADNLDSRPGDQWDTWNDALESDIPATFPCSLAMDIYQGLLGKGFVGTVFAMVNSKLYSRSQNRGPETWRTVGWHLVVAEA